MKSILFVYGTVGGNTQMVVEAVAGLLRGGKFEVELRRAELCDPSELLRFDVCVLASPTYGHGSLETTMAKFVERMKGLKLEGKPCAVVGLGDPRYETQYHLESAPLLEKAIAASGGKLLIPSLKISRTPVMHLKGFIAAWSEQFIKALNQ
jgi:flavodoxin I